jgi:hypothetical protein
MDFPEPLCEHEPVRWPDGGPNLTELFKMIGLAPLPDLDDDEAWRPHIG